MFGIKAGYGTCSCYADTKNCYCEKDDLEGEMMFSLVQFGLFDHPSVGLQYYKYRKKKRTQNLSPEGDQREQAEAEGL